MELVCFVCQWNEGRSAHLEMSVRLKLKARGSSMRVVSAGLSRADGMNPLRKAFLLGLGVPAGEVNAHKSTVFDQAHARADLVLVAELPMKAELLMKWPELTGRVMTVKGFAGGLMPDAENSTEEELRMEDAGGMDIDRKLELYVDHEGLAERVAARLLAVEAAGLPFPWKVVGR